jgi:hypothetical protein
MNRPIRHPSPKTQSTVQVQLVPRRALVWRVRQRAHRPQEQVSPVQQRAHLTTPLCLCGHDNR